MQSGEKNSEHHYLFLEDDKGEACQDFIGRQNEASHQALRDVQFEEDRDIVLDLLQNENRLILPRRRGEWLFEFGRTSKNPRGLWRRLPANEVVNQDAQWEIVFDLDAFCERENHAWVWFGASTAFFDPDKVILALSDGGSDRARFIEFDCNRKCIVENGFDIAPSKASVSWLDPDTIILSSSAGEGDATSSGWPSVIRHVKRGDDPISAPVIFWASSSDVLVSGTVLQRPDDVPLIAATTYHELQKSSVTLLNLMSEPVRLKTPADVYVSCNRTHYFYFTRSKGIFPTGSLILNSFDNNSSSFDQHRAVFIPEDRCALDQFLLLDRWLVWTVLENLKPSLFILSLDDTEAKPVEIMLPEGSERIEVSALDADVQVDCNNLLIYAQGFLNAPVIFQLDLGRYGADAELEEVTRSPERFDARGMTTKLLEACSDDGTKIPYHLVLPANYEQEMGQLPILMCGYGGYEISLKPFYAIVTGKLWLERGGAYVLAYIRGGGEFGPDWHQAAIRENRSRSFEDFAAIAKDLVKRGFTTTEKLACTGGSNGGLLVGVMLTRYPELFGAIWSSVPVMDMLRFHKFAAGQAWIKEYGDPEKEYYRLFLQAYSPLHNVKSNSDCAYPPVYIESNSNDDRVHPSHARRMTAALMDAKQDVLFHEFSSGGHGGAGATNEEAAHWAMAFRFLSKVLMDR